MQKSLNYVKVPYASFLEMLSDALETRANRYIAKQKELGFTVTKEDYLEKVLGIKMPPWGLTFYQAAEMVGKRGL